MHKKEEMLTTKSGKQKRLATKLDKGFLKRLQESSRFAKMLALMNENGNGKAQQSARLQLSLQLVNGNENYATKNW